MTLREALKSGEEYLRARDIEEAGTDAWLLLRFVTGVDRTHFLLERDQEMAQGEAVRYRRLLERRGEHIPLQYLTGEQEFMGLTFRVNEDVLIPRQDTEILVEEALKRLTSQMRVLDLCTGSGCIAISLAKLRKPAGAGKEIPPVDGGYIPAETPSVNRGFPAEMPPVDGADISAKALAVAAGNARLLRADVRLLQSDLFDGILDIYDMIVSNPPYIPTAVIEGLSREVRLHEPRTALDGHEDGLYFYRRIIRESRDHLAEGGWILFEIGFDQGMQVSGLLEEAGYAEVRIVKDLAGLDRVVLGRRENKEEIHV